MVQTLLGGGGGGGGGILLLLLSFSVVNTNTTAVFVHGAFIHHSLKPRPAQCWAASMHTSNSFLAHTTAERMRQSNSAVSNVWSGHDACVMWLWGARHNLATAPGVHLIRWHSPTGLDVTLWCRSVLQVKGSLAPKTKVPLPSPV